MESALRKAALLITALDSRGADALLDQMGEELAARVRNAVLDLDDIDPAEQQQVVAEFLASQGKNVPDANVNTQVNTGGVELELSSAALSAPEPNPPREIAAADSTQHSEMRFEFLHEASASAIAGLIRREHPQTIAIVMSHLTPRRASEVLVLFDSDLQVETLKRIADLDSADEHIIREVEHEIEALLANQFQRRQKRAVGVDAVSAILEEVGVNRNRMQTEVYASTGSADADQVLAHQASMPDQSSDQASEQADKDVPDLEQDAFSFEDVTKLNNKQLAKLFAESEPEATLLALAGSPKPFVDRIVRQLPRKHRKLIQKQLGNIGPLKLRDIEAAQSYLASLAAEILEDDSNGGDSTDLRDPPRFAAAA